MMAKRKWLIGLAVVGIPAAFFAVSTLNAAGAFRQIEPHQPGECYRIEGIIGGEDLQWRSDGSAIFVSAQDRRALETSGFIYLVDPREPTALPVDMTPELDFPFHPHGLYLRTDDDGRERLFVVNHRGGWSPPSTIEIFDVDADGTLTHARSVAGEAILSPNDVVAVGAEQFYFTNDHGSTSAIGKVLENWLRLPLGNVVYFDGEDFRVVYEGTRYANGISVSADGDELYLAETLNRSIKIFDRHAETGDLLLQHIIYAHSGVDNIDVAPDGSLWVGSHPKLLAFVAHQADADSPSPSQVLRFARDERGSWDFEEIYLDDGGPISASATAAVRDGLLVIGPVFDPHLLVCFLDDAE